MKSSTNFIISLLAIFIRFFTDGRYALLSGTIYLGSQHAIVKTLCAIVMMSFVASIIFFLIGLAFLPASLREELQKKL